MALIFLAELVNEVKRRMESEDGQMDDLVVVMGKQWLDESAPADHKRVFARMMFAPIDIIGKSILNISAKKKIRTVPHEI